MFVKDAGGEFVSKPIKTGNSNVSFVAIEEGLEPEAVVALDAYQRGLKEFDSKDDQLPEVPETEDPETENAASETVAEVEDPVESVDG